MFGFTSTRLQRYLLSICAFAAFTIVDPFKVASTTSRSSQEFVYRVLSLIKTDAAANHISVLLIDDRSAREINGENGYPITFSQHASVLRPMLCSGPAALFIDITFRGLRGDSTPLPAADGTDATPIDPLLAALAVRPAADNEYCRLPDVDRFPASSTPRIFMARTRSHPIDACDPLYGALPETCTVGKVIDRLKSVSTPVSVGTAQDDGTYQLANEWPANNGTSTASGLEPSPALAMVFAFCEAAQGTPRAALPGCRDIDKLRSLLDTPHLEERHTLYPTWSFFKTRTYVDDQKAHRQGAAAKPGENPSSTCELQSRPEMGLIEKASLASSELWQSLLPFEPKTTTSPFEQGPCLAADTVSLNDLRQMASYCGPTGEECGERLAKFFSGRLVFYGIDITGINDLVATPVVRIIPGAAYHAAAAETLLNLGAAYHRQPDAVPHTAGFKLTAGHLLDILFFALASAVVALLFHTKHRTLSSYVILAVMIVAGIGAAASLSLAVAAGLPVFTAVTGTLAVAIYCYLIAAVIAYRLGETPMRGQTAGLRAAAMAVGLVLVVPIAVYVMHALHFPPANVFATILLLAQLPVED